MTVWNRLDGAFKDAADEGRAALIPYLTAGYPDPEGYVELAVAVLEAGADALEIGVPFSDPLLDGPSIQASQGVALAAGVTPADCFDYARRIRERSSKPLLFMGAYNPIAAIGPETFARRAQQSGVSALIVPDLPIEEQDELRAACTGNELHVIQLVAPTSTPERLARVCAVASGFVYCISIAGVTGARTGVAQGARPLVERVRKCTELPIAVGFGIAGPAEARAVASFAEGVIVGSALINAVGGTPTGGPINAARTFVAELAEATGHRDTPAATSP